MGDVITQNVDRLHHKAGSRPASVLELHGTTHRVVCMGCGAESCRHEFQTRLEALNPDAAALLAQTMRESDEPGRWRRALRAGTAADARKTTDGEAAERVPVRRPDGDVELVDAGRGFVVPPCPDCGGGVLKPEVPGAVGGLRAGVWTRMMRDACQHVRFAPACAHARMPRAPLSHFTPTPMEP